MVLTNGAPFVHYALVEATGVDVDVRINGCPLDRVESTGRVETSIPISDLLVPGRNAIAIDRVRGAGHATVRVGACRYGEFPDPSTDASLGIVRLRALPEDPTGAEGSASATGIPAWPWLAADRVDPRDTTTRREVLTLLRHVEESLTRNDHAAVLSLLRERLEERAVAFGQDRQAAVRAFTAVTADANFGAFSSVREDELALSSCFDGRALWLGRSGCPYLYAEPHGDWEISLCVARVDGAWKVVRS
jgi:hypothetical protein